MSQSPYDPPPYDPPQHDPYAQQPSGVAPYGSPDDPRYSPAPYPGGAQYGVVYPESSQATLALVLGILGIVVVQLAAPFAWWIGAKERAAIDAGRRDPINRGQAVTGWVLGIIGTVLLALTVIVLVGYVVFIVLVLGGTLASSGTGF